MTTIAPTPVAPRAKTTFQQRVARLFGLEGDKWMRHANPWSVGTRFAAGTTCRSTSSPSTSCTPWPPRARCPPTERCGVSSRSLDGLRPTGTAAAG